MVNDTLSDLLTRIRNGCLNNSQMVSIPLTRLSQQVCHTLEKEGFIESFQRDPVLADVLIIKLKYKDFSVNETSSYNLQLSRGNNLPTLQSNGGPDKTISKINNDPDFVNKTRANSNSVQASERQILSKKRPCITNLKRISKPGLRVYARHKQIPTVLGGLGILILSTPKGIMTDREARFRKVGGEILCSIW